MTAESPKKFKEPIAIVGIGCRLPGGIKDPESFYEFLKEKRSAIAEVPKDRWSDSFYDAEPGVSGKATTKWGGFVDDLYGFDPQFFDISPREVESMDPQQSGLLQVVYEALQDGGVTMEQASRAVTGVFVGITTSDFRSLRESEQLFPAADIYAGTGTTLCIAANRISHRFDLTGPSMAIDTACSSSMVAVDLACRNIDDGACDMAIAAGCNVLASPATFIVFANSNMLSPTGRISTFDSSANGYVRGEGFGAVVLKPLSKALADGDDIYGVIRATVVNQDGRTPTLTSPSQTSQIAMLERLCANGGVDPSQVGYVECHGTGTPTGDPIEAGAVGRVFGKSRREQPLLIGSVKPNVGHLESAAGITGLIKGALIAKHGLVPPNVNFATPNPRIPFDALNLEVPQEVRELPKIGDTNFVVVNSFGFGGTNASALIEAYHPETAAPKAATAPAGTPVIVPLSAATSDSLAKFAGLVANEVAPGGKLGGIALPEIASTFARRRDHLTHRAALVVTDTADLAAKLETLSKGEVTADKDQLKTIVTGEETAGRKIAFTFSGQGSQWYAMGRRLTETETVYADALAEFDAIFAPLAGWSVREALMQDEATSEVDRSAVTQPTICAMQIALAKLWQHWGVKPDMVIGHSLGEVAAAYVAGAIDLETAVRYIHTRSLIGTKAAGKGAMAVVGLSEEDLLPLLPKDGTVEIAGYNAPTTLTITGDADAVAGFIAGLNADRPEVFTRAVKTDTAWHSYQLEAAEGWFRDAVGEIASREPSVTFVSTVTGRPECRLDTNYWWQNLRQPVRYSSAVETAIALGATIFLELAPHRTLAGPTAQSAGAAKPAIIVSLDKRFDDRAAIATAAAELYVRGVALDWANVTGASAANLPLPKYPWANTASAKLPEESELYLFEKPSHPFLGRRLIGPNTTWRTVINQRSFKYLADHRLREECLFPAAGYLETMNAAGMEMWGKGAIELEDVKIYEAMFIRQEQSLSMQTVYEPERGLIKIYSRGEEKGAQWTLRSQARIRQRDASIADAQPGEFKEPLKFPREFWYANAGPQAFIEFGPMFQCVQGVTIETNGYRAVSKLAMPQDIKAKAHEYMAHPAMLDAGLQMTDHNIATLGAEIGSFDKDGRFIGNSHSIPSGIRRVLFIHPLAEEMSLEVKHKINKDHLPVGNTGVFRDAAGKALVVIEDVITKRVPISAKAMAEEGVVLPDILEESYYPIALGTAEPQFDGARILVLADEGGRTAGLEAKLAASGAIVETLKRSDGSANDLFSLREFIEAKLDVPTAAVIYGWSLDQVEMAADASADEIVEAAERDIKAFTAVGQIFEARKEEKQPTAIVVLTEEARQVPGDRPLSTRGLIEAPLVGLARTVQTECDGHIVVSVDLDAHALANPEIIVSAVFGETREAEMVLRAGKAQAPRLERRTAEDLPARTVVVPASDRRTNYYATMKAPGVIDAIDITETDMPVLGDGDTLIEVRAVGLNFRDVMAVTGLLPAEAEPDAAFRNLGLEYAGVVTAIGAGVTDLKIGDRVMGNFRRCLQRFIKLPAMALLKVPDHVPFEGACTTPTAFSTAHYALNHVARLKKGERILIHVATGGVGLAAIQLAKRVGAEIFATAGTEEKRQLLRDMGIEHVMSSRNLDFAEEIMAITGGRGVDVILNSLPTAYIQKGLDILAPYGRFVEIGKRDVYADTSIGMKAMRRNVQVACLDLATMGFDKPELLAQLLVEVAEMLNKGEIETLPCTSFPFSRVTDAFRYMQQAKHVGKIVITFDEPSVEMKVSTDKAFRLDPSASYLVTGGSRGFGIAVADWLSQSGAGRIVLASRSGKTDAEEASKIEGILARGTEVETVALDVADEAQVTSLIASLATAEKPVKGIVHGAAVIEDAFLSQLDDELIHRVVAPKVAGAWALDRALAKAGIEVDFLVSFSSTSQLMGSRGQANYAAANAFLDAFAHYRRGAGKQGFTVDWGPLGGSGFVARNEQLASYMASMGLHLVSDTDATKIMETMLRVDRASLAYTAIEWAKFRRANAGIEKNPRMAPLVADTGASKTRVRAELMALPRDQWIDAACQFVRGEVSKVLKIDADDVPTDRPLSELGLDSLSSFELKSRIEDELAIQVSVSRFLQASTPEKLAAVIVEIIEQQLAAAAAAGSAADGDQAAGGVRSAGVFVPSDRQLGLVGIERGRLSTASARAALVSTLDVRVTPALDTAKVEDALATLAKRHPMLRLKLEVQAGEANLVIGAAPVVNVHSADLPEHGMTLNVGAGELFALHLADEGNATRLVVKAHAAAMDRGSLARVVEELVGLATGAHEAGEETDAEVFAALAKGRFDADTKPSIAHRAFWTEALMDQAPEMKLARRAHPIAPAGLGRTQGAKDVRKLTLDVSGLAGKTAAERESVLLAAFGSALADVADTNRVLVSVASASEAVNLAGQFGYELPVLVNAAAAPAVEARRIARHIAAAKTHGDFEVYAIERLLPASLTALPQAAFAYEAVETTRPALLTQGLHLIGGVLVEAHVAGNDGMTHDIEFAVRDAGSDAIAEFAFDTSAIDEVTAARIVRAIVARVADVAGGEVSPRVAGSPSPAPMRISRRAMLVAAPSV